MSATIGRRRLGLVVLVALVLILAAVGAGWAYFTSKGSGEASASVATLQPVTVTALVGGDTPSSALLPGGSADVILRVNNPNSYPVILVSVTGGPAGVTADGGHPDCTVTGVTFTNKIGLAISIPKSGTTLVRLPNAASMSLASANGCQGATFSISVTITVHTTG